MTDPIRKPEHVVSQWSNTETTKTMASTSTRKSEKQKHRKYLHETSDNHGSDIQTLESSKTTLGEYHDHASDREEDYGLCYDDAYKTQRAKGGVTVTFPLKLHLMLETIGDHGLEHVVSWLPHGRAFKVHKTGEFVLDVMPRFFHQSKITSFQRQLNLYGFHRISRGADSGAYYHELFLRGRAFLCHLMNRTKIKGTGHRQACSPETEPNLHEMPFVKGLAPQSKKHHDSSSCERSKRFSKPINKSLEYRNESLTDQKLQDPKRQQPAAPVSPSGSNHGRFCSSSNVPWKPILPSKVLVSPDETPKERIIPILSKAQHWEPAFSSTKEIPQGPPAMLDLPFSYLKEATAKQIEPLDDDDISKFTSEKSISELEAEIQDTNAFQVEEGFRNDVPDIISFEGKQFHYLSTSDLHPHYFTSNRFRCHGTISFCQSPAEQTGRITSLVQAGSGENSAGSSLFESNEMSAPDFSIFNPNT